MKEMDPETKKMEDFFAMNCFIGYEQNNIQLYEVKLQIVPKPQYLQLSELSILKSYRIPEGYRCLKFQSTLDNSHFSVKCQNKFDFSMELFLFKREYDFIYSTIHYSYQYMFGSDIKLDPVSKQLKVYILEEDTRISVFTLHKTWFKITSEYFQKYVESESYAGGNIARLPIAVENLERGIYVKNENEKGGGKSHLRMEN